MVYKNSQKRIYQHEYPYFVTVNTQDKSLFFKEPIFCDLWIEELILCKKLKSFEINSFCLCYDHFHMVLKVENGKDLSEIMRSLKTNFSRNANRVMLDDFSIKRYNLDEKARSADRAFWQERKLLEKFDKQVEQFHRLFHKKYESVSSFKKFKWQKSFHDHIIRNEKDLIEHHGYTAYNFIKHRLSEDWHYTSLNFPELIDVY